jgi:hypothetical protein
VFEACQNLEVDVDDFDVKGPHIISFYLVTMFVIWVLTDLVKFMYEVHTHQSGVSEFVKQRWLEGLLRARMLGNVFCLVGVFSALLLLSNGLNMYWSFLYGLIGALFIHWLSRRA